MIMRREDDYILQSFAYLSICWRSELIDFSIKQGNGEKSTNKNKKLCHQFFSGTGGWNSDNSLIHKPLVVLKKKDIMKEICKENYRLIFLRTAWFLIFGLNNFHQCFHFADKLKLINQMIAFKTNYTFLYRIMKPTFDKFTIIYNSTVIQLNII